MDKVNHSGSNADEANSGAATVMEGGKKADPMVVRHRGDQLHHKLLDAASPPSLVIDKDHRIVHLSGRVGKFLKLNHGGSGVNLLEVVHPGLRTELRAALFQSSKSEARTGVSGILVEVLGAMRLVDITVEPAPDGLGGCRLLLFRDRDPEEPIPASAGNDDRLANLAVLHDLEKELFQARAGWRKSVDNYEESVEELRASNEELQSTNEELRSATEELETGREELQATNEEVLSVNQKLRHKVDELGRLNSDLQNLMASTRIATVFLNRDLRIQRFTPSATMLFNLMPSDLDRPFSDITHKLDYPEILRDARLVLEDLTLVEREVRNPEGQWFLSRMTPYRTTEQQIAGVVVTFVDITERKGAEEFRRWLSSIVESSKDAIISFTLEGKIVSWNQGAERIFGYDPEEIQGKSLEIFTPPDREQERADMLGKLRQGEAVDSFDTVRLRKDGTPVDVSLSVSVIRNERGELLGATGIVQDITRRKEAENGLAQARQELETRVQERTAELRRRIAQLAIMTSELTLTEQRERKRLAQVLHDQLQQILVAAKLRIESLGHGQPSKEEIARLAALMDEALSNSRSVAVDLSPPILAEGLGRALTWLGGTWMREKHGLNVTLDIDESIDAPQFDLRVLLYLAAKELLFNVVKHSNVNEATLELGVLDEGHLRITIRDHGDGFDTGRPGDCGSSGTGFGLLGLYERLEMLGGKLQLESKPEYGVKAVIIAPMLKIGQTENENNKHEKPH